MARAPRRGGPAARRAAPSAVLLPGGEQAVAVAAAVVLEAERIDGAEAGVPLLERVGVEQEGQALAGREAERGAAPCAAPRVLLDVGAVDDLPAGLALDPEALGLDLLVLLAEDPRH